MFIRQLGTWYSDEMAYARARARGMGSVMPWIGWYGDTGKSLTGMTYVGDWEGFSLVWRAGVYLDYVLWDSRLVDLWGTERATYCTLSRDPPEVDFWCSCGRRGFARRLDELHWACAVDLLAGEGSPK
jgi:hypothetical protein